MSSKQSNGQKRVTIEGYYGGRYTSTIVIPRTTEVGSRVHVYAQIVRTHAARTMAVHHVYSSDAQFIAKKKFSCERRNTTGRSERTVCNHHDDVGCLVPLRKDC